MIRKNPDRHQNGKNLIAPKNVVKIRLELPWTVDTNGQTQKHNHVVGGKDVKTVVYQNR